MKKNFQKLQRFKHWMDELKFDRKALIVLIVLDILMAFGSNMVDWPAIITVAEKNWYLTIFVPICSLYPLTLAIWFLLYLKKIKIPAWYSTFIFIGITSYGAMSLIYFPLFMTWDGFVLRTFGNMLWVITYALQSLIIVSELKIVPLYQYALIIGYFIFKDYSDRFLGTFLDIFNPGYPNYITAISWPSIIILHLIFITAAIKIAIKNRLKIGITSPPLTTVDRPTRSEAKCKYEQCAKRLL